MSLDVANYAHASSERYLNYLPELVQRWDGDSASANHRLIDGTMVFADISGFTAMSEKLSRFGKVGAEEVTDVLGECFTSLLAVAYPLGGVLIKFGGDALLLLFDGEGHQGRAVNAAVGMQEVMRRVGKVSTSAGPIRLRMSVGAHSGSFHFFLAGESHRELVLTGPAATRTVEMEAAADADEIVISPETAAALPEMGTGKGPGFLVESEVSGVAEATVDVRQAGDDLERYVPVAVRQSILAGVTEPEHRRVTVAFLHFMGIDGLLSTEGPDLVGGALHELVTDVQEAIDPRRVAFLATDVYDDGGKIILAAGAPVTTGNDSERMLRALRDIMDRKRTLPVRVGVNRGHVFAGDVGPSYRRTYTIMGDDVNLAARLMAAARPGEIYATPLVLRDSRTLFGTVELPPLTVKGKEEPVQACVVGEETGTRIGRRHDDLPFVGRREELAALTRALQRATEGTGDVVTIIGDRGVGKTRLIQEALASVPEVTSVIVPSEPYGIATPYRPFRDPVRELLGIERADQDVMAGRLRGRVEELDPDLLPFLPLLADVVHVEVPETPETAAIDPQFRQDRLADVVIKVLERAGPGPLALVFEEAHWMDDASSELSERLCSATSDHPWLLVATRTTGETGGFTPLDPSPLELQPLEAGDAEAIAIAATESSPLRPHEVNAIVQRAGGNPLFLAEILKVVRRTGSADDLPDSLETLVSAQIDALAPLPKRLLRYASVLGRSFRLTVLNEVLEDEPFAGDSQGSLEGFLEPDGEDRMRFRHAMLRDTAYEGLSYRKRRELHSRAAHATEQLAGRYPETVADVLALHYSLAQERPCAWHYAKIAGEQAMEAFANVEAATQFERALEAARRLPGIDAGERAGVWEALGDVRERVGLYEEAVEAYRHATRLLGDDPIDRADLQLKRARARMRAGSYVSALGEITRGLRALESLPTGGAAGGARARLISFRGTIRLGQQKPGEALAAAERAVELAKASAEDDALARAYSTLDWAHTVLGQPGLAVHGLDALEIYERLGDLGSAAAIMNNLGGLAYFNGDWDAARAWYARCMDAYRRAGNDVGAAGASALIAEVLVSQRRIQEAEPMLREGVRVLRASGAVTEAMFAETQLARLLAIDGRTQEARSRLDRLRSEAADLGHSWSALEAGLHLAEVHVREGDAGGAIALLDEVQESAGEGGAVFAAALSRVRANALTELGSVQEAAAEVQKGLVEARRQGLPYEEALLLQLGTELARRMGFDPEPSHRDAEALLERLGIHR